MAVLVAILAVGMAGIWSVGILAWAGGSLNLVVVTMPAILAVTTMTQGDASAGVFFTICPPQRGILSTKYAPNGGEPP